jgi:hypothetical protein
VFPASWTREYKFWPSVARIDNVYGDRNLFCACPPKEDEIRDLPRTMNDSRLTNSVTRFLKILAGRFHESAVIKGCNLETVANGLEARMGWLSNIRSFSRKHSTRNKRRWLA